MDKIKYKLQVINEILADIEALNCRNDAGAIIAILEGKQEGLQTFLKNCADQQVGAWFYKRKQIKNNLLIFLVIRHMIIYLYLLYD